MKRFGNTTFNGSFKALARLEGNRTMNRAWKNNFSKVHDQLEKAYKDMNEDLSKLTDKKLLEKIQGLAKAVKLQKENLKELK